MITGRMRLMSGQAMAFPMADPSMNTIVRCISSLEYGHDNSILRSGKTSSSQMWTMRLWVVTAALYCKFLGFLKSCCLLLRKFLFYKLKYSCLHLLSAWSSSKAGPDGLLWDDVQDTYIEDKVGKAH